ncbi:hypothetical protein QTH90_13165 [Variovorax sp. J2P1-59]|uniref:hypothetical protein n=1 Tax=Variovorax flavidus TaxID=3053501 RepID=UPI002574D818|nr:hypothetical protein [Variovorax sp. J2P1-59]MDM0075343.1 hypothetical protein [Variovorax sp. J2P1-59]
MMGTSPMRWPRVRPLVVLLQSPAHRVMRVLHVTQSHWQLPERRGRSGRSLRGQFSAQS